MMAVLFVIIVLLALGLPIIAYQLGRGPYKPNHVKHDLEKDWRNEWQS